MTDFDIRNAPRDEPEEVGGVDDRPAPTQQLVPWLQLRHALGASRDRRKWLQFFCATTDYDPLPWQVRAHLADSGNPDIRTNKLAECGVGAGKTEFATSENCELQIANPGCDHVIVAPTYDLAREVLLPRWMQRMEQLADSGYPLLRKCNWSILRFDLHCGGRVFLRSADKVNNLRGFQFCSLGGDEWDFTRNPMDIWDVLSGRLRDQRAYVRQATITTTPYNYANSIIEHFALQREAALAIEDPLLRDQRLREWWFCRAPTHSNPYLPKDYLAGLESYSKSKYIREVLAYPTIHRAARVYPEYSDVHAIDVLPDGKPLFDKNKPYDIAIDWGYHRPAFIFIQCHGAIAVVFAEWMPDDLSPERQLDGVKQLCRSFGRDPENAAVDRADTDQIEKFKRIFRSTRVVSAVSRQEQSRVSTVDAVQRLLDPVDGQPKLFIARALTEKNASDRGVHQAISNLEWEYDRVNNRYLDNARKDGKYEHAAECLGYWCKLIGLDRAKAYTIQPISHGARASDLLASLRRK